MTCCLIEVYTALGKGMHRPLFNNTVVKQGKLKGQKWNCTLKGKKKENTVQEAVLQCQVQTIFPSRNNLRTYPWAIWCSPSADFTNMHPVGEKADETWHCVAVMKYARPAAKHSSL